MRTLHKVNQETYALVFKALLKEAQTVRSIEDITGLHRNTIYDLFRTLRKHKVVHITDWEQDKLGRDSTPVFTLGVGKDKPRFRMPRSEVYRRYRLRNKQKEATAVLDNIIRGVSNAQCTDTETCTT